jgi:hypothetical protein
VLSQPLFTLTLGKYHMYSPGIMGLSLVNMGICDGEIVGRAHHRQSFEGIMGLSPANVAIFARGILSKKTKASCALSKQ